MTPPSLIAAHDITVGYGGDPVIHALDLDVRRGDFMVIVGPNGCGKSTLLKALARVNRPSAGQVQLDGEDVHRMRGRAVAKRVSLLPQSAVAPKGITVAELVARGRHPHHSLLRQWSPEDDRAIATALERTHLSDLADTAVDALSGGQRQRVWVAMILAQDTEVILLDEPTTFLDIAHQYELLELFAELNREGRTIVAVLHDLNQAARFASRLVVMSAGRIHGDGQPATVLTEDLVREVFGLGAEVVDDPQSGTPMVVPHVRPHLARP
ncbi:ABC transporter ATP-binding protein [Janibacter limosus]|uniref:ABC transporter ATP-binding protein n=1 Tax=Janibacter limosus TaxID=53458 RepID=A0A4P6MVE7_9MICO|nr:ABC transporter ATP-binding protein [Janibacter limosus]QBF45530.1 ABC transporter ATP-binding protein [Janibacter limosus]